MSNYYLESTNNTIEKSFEKSKVLSTLESNSIQILGKNLIITKRHNNVLSVLALDILFVLFTYLSLHDILQLSATCAEMYEKVRYYMSTQSSQSIYEQFRVKIKSYMQIPRCTDITIYGILNFYKNLHKNNSVGYQNISHNIINYFIKCRNEYRLISQGTLSLDEEYDRNKIDYAICYMSVSIKQFTNSILTSVQKWDMFLSGIISGHMPFYYGYMIRAKREHELLQDVEQKNLIKASMVKLYGLCIAHKNLDILQLMARDFDINILDLPKMNMFNYVITKNLPELFVVIAKQHIGYLSHPSVYSVLLDLIYAQQNQLVMAPENAVEQVVSQKPPHIMLECMLDILYESFQLNIETFVSLINAVVNYLIEFNRIDLLLFVLDKYSSYTQYSYSQILRQAIYRGKERHNWSIDVIEHFMKSNKFDRLFLYSSCINSDNSVVLEYILDKLQNIQGIDLNHSSATFKPTDLFICLGLAVSKSALKVIDVLVERMEIDLNMLYDNVPLLVLCVDKKTKLVAKFLSMDTIIRPTQEILNLALNKSITDGNDIGILTLIKNGACIAHNNYEIISFALEKNGLKTLARKIKKQMTGEMYNEYMLYETRDEYKTLFASL